MISAAAQSTRSRGWAADPRSYEILVKRLGDGGAEAVAWPVLRRYSEFEDLHELLLRRHQRQMKGVWLPAKRLTWTRRTGITQAFCNARRTLLDGYLQVPVSRPSLLPRGRIFACSAGATGCGGARSRAAQPSSAADPLLVR